MVHKLKDNSQVFYEKNLTCFRFFSMMDVMRSTGLTKRQQKVLQFIEHFAETEKRSPTLKEITAGVGCSAVSTAHKHVLHLIEKGFLERQHGRGNNIAICRLGQTWDSGNEHFSAPRTGMRTFPFYGDVAAGAPMLPETHSVPIELPQTIHRNKESLFVLRVRGDSMMDASILDGDLVVLQRRGEYRNGDNVVALIDREEATLKELRMDDKGVWLIPHNPALSPRHYNAGRIEVQGVLVGVLRSC